MKTIYSSLRIKTVLHFALMVAMLSAFTLQGFAQNTAAGTPIKNTASATYGDGSGPPTEYSTVSNEVVVTVARVAGLRITPDATTNSTVVAGQTGVEMDFDVTNIGNFDDVVRFLASNGSWQFPAGITPTAAVIDPTATTPVNIFNQASTTNYSLDRGDTVVVRLTFDVATTVASGTPLQVFLGDQTTISPTFDNDAANASPSEVSTVSTSAVNGSREARGDITVVVEPDAQIQVGLTAPAGPIALGGDITYNTTVCNPGSRDLDPFDPDGAGPAGIAIWVVAPIPVGTALKTFPAGTLFSTTDATTNPLTPADWTAAPPASLATVKRILLRISTTALAFNSPTPSCTNTTPLPFTVTVTTNNANTPISLIVDAFGNNSNGVTITDQSGDTTPGTSSTPPPGTPVDVPLTVVSGVLNGPDGAANASGPTNNNDDFTNKSASAGIAGVAPGGVTTAVSGLIGFTNSLQNTGNADDTFTLTYVPGSSSLPTGSTIEIFDGTAWVNVTDGTASVDVAVPFGTALVDYLVRVNLPSGETVLTGYDAVIRATSQTNTALTNDTIDRVYTGFVRLVKSAVVSGGIAAGGTSNTDAIPGAVITYSVVYTNISTVATGGSIGLTASSLVITENGNVAPNDWGATTDQVVNSASDATTGAVITGDSAGSSVLTDTIPSLAPQANGTFSFARTIK